MTQQNPPKRALKIVQNDLRALYVRQGQLVDRCLTLEARISAATNESTRYGAMLKSAYEVRERVEDLLNRTRAEIIKCEDELKLHYVKGAGDPPPIVDPRDWSTVL